MNKTSGRVKNPCKICLQTVNTKNGLQCLGACKKWAHFTCLNFTPGKIQDIKAGLIKVTCPCPGCNTAEPKEYIICPPLTCTNKGCAANKLPRDDSFDYPSNRPKPIPPAPESRPATQAYASNTTLKSFSSSPCPLCPPYSSCPPCPPTPECPNKLPVASSESPRTTPPRPKSPSQPRSRAPTKSSPPTKSPPPATSSPSPTSPARSVSPETPPLQSSPTPSVDEATQRKPQPPSSKRHQQPITNEPKDQRKVTPQRSQSCSCISADSRCKQKFSSISEANLASNNQLLFKALEEMCRTVGELSIQLKELMCKMINSVQDST